MHIKVEKCLFTLIIRNSVLVVCACGVFFWCVVVCGGFFWFVCLFLAYWFCKDNTTQNELKTLLTHPNILSMQVSLNWTPITVQNLCQGKMEEVHFSVKADTY